MIFEAIETLTQRNTLNTHQAEEAMAEIVSKKTTSAQIAAFLTALKMKGESAEEIIGGMRGIMRKAIAVETCRDNLMDLCGTGGDGQSTFNISTISSFVASGAGVNVAKHGNRSVSSRCGSADLLEALGIDLTLSPSKVARGIDEFGYGFLFAPNFHPAMQFALKPRQEIGVRTIFNILGPLVNPMRVKKQLVGVYSADLLIPVAKALHLNGTEKALIIHSKDGLDEISISAATQGILISQDKMEEIEIAPEDFCIKRRKLDEIKTYSLDDNVEVFYKVLNAERGPERDIVVLNSGAAIHVSGLADDIREGIEMARESIDSGKTLELFSRYLSFSKRN